MTEVSSEEEQPELSAEAVDQQESMPVAIDKTIEAINTEVADGSMQIIDEAESNQFEGYLEQLPKIEGAVDFSRLKKIGKGGTHDVYEYGEDSRCVVKIDRGVLDRVLQAGGGETLPENLAAQAESYLSQKNGRNEELYGAFGDENCMREKAMRAKVSINTPKGIVRVETVIVIQEKSDIFSQEDTVDFSTTYEGKLSRDIEETAKSDPSFRQKLVEFLTHFKEYFERTGKFIDLVGEKNVLFYRDENGQWQYKIGSVIKGDTLEDYQKAKQKSQSGEALSKGESDQLKNGQAVSSFANKTGEACGMGTIIDLNETPPNALAA